LTSFKNSQSDFADSDFRFYERKKCELAGIRRVSNIWFIYQQKKANHVHDSPLQFSGTRNPGLKKKPDFFAWLM